MVKFLDYTWCLLNTIVGHLVVLFIGAVRITKGVYVQRKKCGSVSLGNVVILNENDVNNERILTHEFGHSIQSYILGPLYLLVILIPSMIWYGIWTKWLRNSGISYYWFYTERWAEHYADKLR